jgi:Cu-Zn family superoxide dismutase
MSASAVCVLVGAPGGAAGVVHFAAGADGATRVTGRVSGLAPGLHGFHVHQFGDTTNGCAS